MSRTVMQKITDALEAGGVPVSSIETFPPYEDGRVLVALVVRPVENEGDDLENEDRNLITKFEDIPQRLLELPLGEVLERFKTFEKLGEYVQMLKDLRAAEEKDRALRDRKAAEASQPALSND